MPIKVTVILSSLLGLLAFAVAAPAPKGPAPKGKAAPPAKAAVASKAAPKAAAKAPSVAQSKLAYRAPVAAKGKAPAASAQQQRGMVNSRAVYSRTPARYTRVPVNTAAGRRAAMVRPVQPVAPAVPSQDRYKEIQQALADKGFYKGEVSGTWSPESVEALKNFQRSQNLEADGKLGSLSLIAMGLGPKRLTAQAIPPPTATPQPQQPQQP